MEGKLQHTHKHQVCVDIQKHETRYNFLTSDDRNNLCEKMMINQNYDFLSEIRDCLSLR